MLAAFAFWGQRNIKETGADARQRIAAICRLIRFPDIPACVLLSYHKCHSFMRTFDPDRELLCLAVSRQQEDLLATLTCHHSLLIVRNCRSPQQLNLHRLQCARNFWQAMAETISGAPAGGGGCRAHSH